MRRDEGSITVLVAGFTAVLLLVIAVVVDVSAVVLARRGAASAADGAAVAAAQELDVRAAYRDGLLASLPLSIELVARSVAAYQERSALAQPGLVLVPDVASSGTTVSVTATRPVRLPFTGWLGLEAVTVSAVATARAPLRP